MIQEVKNFGKNLIGAVTPLSLAECDISEMDVNGHYDWDAQAYRYDGVCNAGSKTKTVCGACYVTDDHQDD